VKPFKIKAIKTYVSYVTTFVILRACVHKRNKKMVSSQELYNIRLKTSLFEATPCYNDFKKLFYGHVYFTNGPDQTCLLKFGLTDRTISRARARTLVIRT